MKRLLTIGLAALALLASPANANDLKDVEAAVQKYLDGTEFGKPGLVRETFLESLEIQFVAPDGSLGRIKAGDYIGRIEEGRKANRDGHIVSVDVTGNAATVKAEIDMGKRVYTDYLLLLKLSDGWQITNKIATYRTKEVAVAD